MMFISKANITTPALIQMKHAFSRIVEYSSKWFRLELMPISEILVSHTFKEYLFCICTESVKYLGMCVQKDITHNINNIYEKVYSDMDRSKSLKVILWGKVNTPKMNTLYFSSFGRVVDSIGVTMPQKPTFSEGNTFLNYISSKWNLTIGQCKWILCAFIIARSLVF